MFARLRRADATPFIVGAVAAVAMFIGLGSRSLWFDEAFSLRVAQLPLERFINTARDVEPFNALYYSVLRGWIAVAGDSPIAVRMPSAVAAVVAVVATYLVGRRLLSERAAIIGAGFLIFHALLIQYAQEVRAYALAVGLITVASWLLLRAVERPTILRWALYGVAGILAIYAHFFAGFVIAAHVLVVAVTPSWRERLWLVLATYAVTAAAAAPLGWWLVNTTVSRGWMDPLGPNTPTTVFQWFGGGSGVLDGTLGRILAACAAVLIVGAIAFGSVRWRRNEPDRLSWLFLVAWMVTPVVAAVAISLLIRPVLAYRYLIVVLPAFCLLVGAMIDAAFPRRALLAAVAVPVAIIVVAGAGTAYLAPLKKPAWGEAAAMVLAEAEPGDKLVVWPNWQWVPLEYALRQLDRDGRAPERVAVNPAVGDVEQTLDDLASDGDRVWLLVSEGGQRPDLHAFDYLDDFERRFRLEEDRSVYYVRLALFEAAD